MRSDHIDSTAIELLPQEQSRDLRHRLSYDPLHSDDGAIHHDHDLAARHRRRQTAMYASLVALTSAPIFILAAFSPTLSRKVAYNGCLGNGDFRLPFTSSIWEPSHFFTINLSFTGASDTSYGYSFAQVKVIDLAWDVLVGRGGQAFLIWVAYRLFNRVVQVLMGRGEVGFDLFASVAFSSGTVGALWTLLRHALGRTPLPRSRHAKRTYWAMAAASLYIITMPTLFSAMTGYTNSYTPFMSFDNGVYDSDVSTTRLLDCGELLPAWGDIGQRYDSYGSFYTSNTIDYDHPPMTSLDSMWIDYYHRYADVYAQCPSTLNISDCSAANKSTWAHESFKGGLNFTLDAPMPGIVTWPDQAPHYTHWDCGGEIVETSQLRAYAGNVTGLCQAGPTYAWGFSFLFTFLVSIFTFTFALTMYGLWLEVHKYGAKEHGNFKNAVTMVTQAQARYGEKVGDWSASTLEKEIVKGQQGMTTASIKSGKATDKDYVFGDPFRGDWGGNVVE